ncbi:MAG: helix-turn-helix domain-containing protein [Bacteroidota bacterium]
MNTGNFLDILILFGSIQGFISSFILLSKKNQIANHLLAAILIIISLACLNIYLFLVLPVEVPFIITILEKTLPLIIFMPLGPLIYFYIRSSTGLSFQFKANRSHFLPILLDLIPYIISLFGITLFVVGYQSGIETNEMMEFKEAYEKYVDAPRWLSTSIYLVLSIRFLRANPTSSKRKSKLSQFIVGFGIFQVLWLLHLIPYLLPSTSNWLLGTLSWYPIYLPLTLLVYWLGITGLIRAKNNMSPPIDHMELKQTMATIEEAMKKDLFYLNPGFSLSDLVEKTSIDQKTISAALNQDLGKSFNEYVNELRVKEVQTKMLDTSFSHLSITGIALESGFNSQATFQRAFKAATNMTPKAWRSSMRVKNN